MDTIQIIIGTLMDTIHIIKMVRIDTFNNILGVVESGAQK